MATSENPRETSALDWLKQADNFLPREDVAQLRRKLSDGIRERTARARQEVQRLERELAALGEPKSEEVHDEPQSFPLNAETSVGKLVLAFAAQSPGQKSGAFVEFVRKYRPRTDAKAVHAELYRLSKPDGPVLLRKEGDKPETKYFPNPRSEK